MLRILPLILALTLVPACSAPAPGGVARSKPVTPSKAPEKSLDEKLASKEAELNKLQRDLEAAELDLRLGTLEAEAERLAATRKVRGAEREVFIARDALSSYREVESAAERETVQIQADRTVSQLEAERADLNGILEIYRDEEEARAKDEIIRRHQKSLEFAERNVDLARSKARLVLEFEVPRKTEKLEWALEKAEADLASLERAAERTEMKGRLGVTRKESVLMDLTSKLELARAAWTKLRTQQDSAE